MPLSRRPGPYVSRSPSSRQRGGLPQDAASAHQKCGCRTPGGARFIAPWTAFVRLLLWLPRSTEPSQGQRFGIAALRRPLRRSAKVASDLGDGGNSPGMDRTSLPARYQVALGDVRLELGFRVQACHGQGARHRKRLHRSSRRRERVEGFREPGIRRLPERVSTGVGSWEKYPSTC